MSKPLIRICPPSKYDHEPFKTVCYVNEEKGRSVFIQVSEDEENPEWVEMGHFLLTALNTKLTDKKSIDGWMKDYHDK